MIRRELIMAAFASLFRPFIGRTAKPIPSPDGLEPAYIVTSGAGSDLSLEAVVRDRAIADLISEHRSCNNFCTGGQVFEVLMSEGEFADLEQIIDNQWRIEDGRAQVACDGLYDHATRAWIPNESGWI
jgi:hypothetical protein